MIPSPQKKVLGSRPFQLKGTSVTLTVLELYSPDLGHFDASLKQKILQAPLFFRSTPIVVDLQKLVDPGESLDLKEVITKLKDNNLVPVAVRGGSSDHQKAALELGFGVLSTNRREEVEEEIKAPPPVPAPPATRVITKPVRSGQQIYAQGTDLLVLSSVSVGAEIVADGHIHVYAPLRGKALAGVSGNTNARIFCSHLESELVSIAGFYKLSEQLKTSSCWKSGAHIFFEDKNLRVEPLS